MNDQTNPFPITEVHDTEKTAEQTLIKSLWLKENTWKKLLITKAAFHLTWSEFFDLLIKKVEQTSYLPVETRKKLQDISPDSLETPFEKNIYGLGPPPWENTRIIHSIKEETQLLNLHLQQLISTLEDHAETLIETAETTNIPL